MPQGSPATHGYRAEVSNNSSSEDREKHSGAGSFISNAQPGRGALGTQTDTKHPHTCSSSICTHHPRADRRWPTEHGKKHRAAIWVSLPLIRGMVVTAPGPGHGKAQGQVALRSKHTLHWELTTLQKHGAALGQRGREGTALEHSALGSTLHGPSSKHKLPGEQHACTRRPLHHHRKARPRQIQAHLVSQPAR